MLYKRDMSNTPMCYLGYVLYDLCTPHLPIMGLLEHNLTIFCTTTYQVNDDLLAVIDNLLIQVTLNTTHLRNRWRLWECQISDAECLYTTTYTLRESSFRCHILYNGNILQGTNIRRSIFCGWLTWKIDPRILRLVSNSKLRPCLGMRFQVLKSHCAKI